MLDIQITFLNKCSYSRQRLEQCKTGLFDHLYHALTALSNKDIHSQIYSRFWSLVSTWQIKFWMFQCFAKCWSQEIYHKHLSHAGSYYHKRGLVQNNCWLATLNMMVNLPNIHKWTGNTITHKSVQSGHTSLLGLQVTDSFHAPE